jgi:hypothetical protein
MNNKRKELPDGGESSDSKKQKTELTKKEKMVHILDYYIFEDEYGLRPDRDLDYYYGLWEDDDECYDISLEDMKEFIKQNRQVRIYNILNPSYYTIKVSVIAVDDKVYYPSLRLEYSEKIYFGAPIHGVMLKKWIDKTLKALYDPNIFLLAQKQEENKNLFTIKGNLFEEATLEMEPLSRYIIPHRHRDIDYEVNELILQARKFVWNQAKKIENKNLIKKE